MILSTDISNILQIFQNVCFLSLPGSRFGPRPNVFDILATTPNFLFTNDDILMFGTAIMSKNNIDNCFIIQYKQIRSVRVQLNSHAPSTKNVSYSELYLEKAVKFTFI